MNRPLVRDVIGFVGGGVAAAVSAAFIFQMFFPLPPEPKRADHTGEALAILVLVVFFCGGFIGRRAFSADSWSDLLPSVTASYVIMLLLCFLASLDIRETATMIGFASAGFIVSTALLLLLRHRFPARIESYEV